MIFPFVEPQTEEINGDLPIAKEWAWDFTNNDFALKNSKPYLIEGLEAVKVWVYKALLTERFKHIFYSDDYGSELTSLIGSGFSQAAAESEAKRLIEEALMPNPYIEGTRDITVKFDNESLSIEFVLETVYGLTEVKI
jgi:hypothetical protein